MPIVDDLTGTVVLGNGNKSPTLVQIGKQGSYVKDLNVRREQSLIAPESDNANSITLEQATPVKSDSKQSMTHL